MNAHKVRVHKHDLDYFRRLARDSDLEIEAYLIGTHDEDVTTVSEFLYTNDYSIQKPNAVTWSSKAVEGAEKRARETGKRIIGSIHTHPNYAPIMSKSDINGMLKVKHKILGICEVRDRKTFVVFWVPDSALHCKLVYVK